MRSAGLLAVGTVLLVLPQQGTPERRADRVDPLPRAVREAVDRGLAYLASNQAEHGSLGEEFRLASTSLAGLAFLAGGSQYNRGRYGTEVRKCLEFLESSWQQGTGLFQSVGDPAKNGRMHSQGYALLFLAEIYGMVPPEDQAQLDLKEKIHRTIDVVLEAQTPNGGWGYYLRGEPGFGADEASTTVCQIQALRACRNAGLTVDAARIDRAVDYVRRCAKGDGSFRYSIKMGELRSSYELTAAAVSTLNASGIYEAAELKAGMEYMRKALERARKPSDAAEDFYFYGNFYAAQALHQAGGEMWRRHYPEIRDNLVERQRPDGSWGNPRGDTYATAMAVLILEVPLEYLPIFQR
jgi:prenyltransferase beta subunit